MHIYSAKRAHCTLSNEHSYQAWGGGLNNKIRVECPPPYKCDPNFYWGGALNPKVRVGCAVKTQPPPTTLPQNLNQ